MEKQKTCRTCEQKKNLTEFYVHKQMADGHLNICIACTKARVAKHRGVHLKEIREYDRERSKTPERRQHIRDTVTKWRADHPDRWKAQCAVNNAVRDGRLFKPSHCERCPRTDIHGHHDDYTKPLDVMWLCPACHKQKHKELDASKV